MTVKDDVDIVRANSAAFSDRDVDSMLQLYATDAVVTDHRRLGLGTFEGHEQLRPYYLGIFHSVDALREDLDVLAAAEGVVVAHAETWARIASDRTGEGVTTIYGMILRLHDGKIAKLEVYHDGAEALEASGLG